MTYRFYQWRNWWILALAFMVVFFHRYSTAVVTDDLARDMELTGTQISNLGSMYFYAYALMQLPSGLLSDFLGPRRTVTVGMLLAGVGAILFGLAPGINLAYYARLLVGLGVSVVFISLLKIQSVWFAPERFATMTGFASFVGNIGAVLATTPLAMLVLAIGWRQSFVAMGALSMLLVVATWLFVLDSPAKVGLEGAGQKQNRPRFGLWQGIRRVIRVPGTWINFVIIAGLMGGVMSFSSVWGVPYLMQVYGFDKAQASQYVLMLNMGILVGSFFVGMVADKLGKKKPLIIGGCMGLTFFWLYIVVFAQGMPPVWLLTPLYFSGGILGVVYVLCFASVKEVNHPELSGTATGVVNIAGFFAASVANLAIGWSLDKVWDGKLVDGVRFYGQTGFQQAMIILVAFAALALAASFLLPEKRRNSSLGHYAESHK